MFPAFTVTQATCTVSYTNAITPVNTWISGVSDNAGLGETVGWSTIDEFNVGFYTITITAADAQCPD